MTGVESSGGSDTEATTPTPKPQGTLDEPHRLRHSSAAALVGLCIGVVLLVVSGCLIADRSTEPAASKTAFRTSAPPSITTPTTTARATTPVSAPPVTPVGGGAAFGRVTTNDGKTLVVANLATGSNINVHTTARTRVYVMLATRAADIRVGATVAVFGQKQSDHSIVAGVITGFSIGAPTK
ncbi:hypothetical protein AB0B25_27025 [Nocardia sp. NPDC049190]|uniref:hypothetical protein n=1 Tax=Nocardia sp. NPDC049190 TaxID=3155650 RepID=UPI0033E52101